MKRLPEQDLNLSSAEWGAEYVHDRMRTAQLVEKNMALNCAASGFYMGARFVEQNGGGEVTYSAKSIATHARNAGELYIKTKLQGLTGDLLNIARVALQAGFKRGVEYRESGTTSAA